MAFIASVYTQITRDRSGDNKSSTVYNRATGEHQKAAPQSRGMSGIMDDKQRMNPTDAKVREHLRRAGA